MLLLKLVQSETLFHLKDSHNRSVNKFLAYPARFDGSDYSVISLLLLLRCMGKHNHIRACRNCTYGCFAWLNTNSAHFQIVSDDYALEAKLVSKQIGDNRPR